MLKPLLEVEKDYAYSLGFIQEWLKDAPAQVREHLTIVESAVSGYRESYVSAQEDYTKLNDLYTKLTALSAGYLETMRQQREQIGQLLAEQQEEFHTKERPDA